MRLQFAPFTVDTDTRQLLRDGSDVHLSPKAFELLCRLVVERPRVVEKDELLKRIWPDTFVVDANLNVLIGEIRRVLDDSVKQPHFIRTVHGVGYAFCGNAVDTSDDSRPVPARLTACWVMAKGRTFRLTEGENVVGRDPESNVWLDADSVSRRHARIVVDSARRRVTLDDLDSRNGTHLGGRPVRERVELSDGDEIVFGAVRVTLRSWSPATAAETKRIRRLER